jgi:peptidyl-prolyl cis-trans isomerase SurA
MRIGFLPAFMLFNSERSNPLPLLLLLTGILCAPALAQAQIAPGTVLDEIVAVVETHPILASEVEVVAGSMAQDEAVTEELWSRALDELIHQQVLVARAERDTTIIVTDEQVNQQLDQQIQQMAQQVGGEAQLETYYGQPMEEIRARFRDDVRRQILAQQYQGRRLRAITVTPAEVREWFSNIPESERPDVPELVRVAHIVKVPEPDEAAREAARTKTEALRDSILAEQATIEDLARRHTDDRSSAVRGGRYDDTNVRELVPEFGLIAATLEPGGLSQVFETQFGYHVMRLNERRGDIISFNHILVRVDDSDLDPSETIRTLEVLRDSIVTLGYPFERIAKNNSDDPYTAQQGGYLADQRSGERELQSQLLGPLWQATLDTLEVGEVSAPAEIDMADGSRAWHIVLLQRRTPPHQLNLETDYAILSDYALREKQARELNAWLRELRRTVYVEVRTERYVPLPAG